MRNPAGPKVNRCFVQLATSPLTKRSLNANPPLVTPSAPHSWAAWLEIGGALDEPVIPKQLGQEKIKATIGQHTGYQAP
jgi:hypothetical protein